MSHGILVIEDEETLAKNIKRYLERSDYEVRLAASGEFGLEAFTDFHPDLVLLDYQLPGRDGLKILQEIRALDAQVKVIMVTAHGTIEIAVEAMKAGACDYLSKPLVLGELKLLINKALGQERLEGALSYFQTRAASTGGIDALLGRCDSVEALRQKVRQIVAAESALTDDSPPAVLIAGETGTGKELVAKALHFEGPRRARPFVELNCAALPEQLIEAEMFGYERGAFTDAKDRKMGLAEAAHGGTLFLDEISEMSQPVQAKLLKVLEDKTIRRLGSVRDRTVNVRIVAATNRPLEDLVNRRAFRSDLYFRLRMLTLTLPPLRERKEDIPLLSQHFLDLHSKRYRRQSLHLSTQAKQALQEHEWPGNVRELRNVLEQAVLLSSGDVIDTEQLALAPGLKVAGKPVDTARSGRFPITLPQDGMNLETLERNLVSQALERTSWNVTQAAPLLGLSRDTLRYRIGKYRLSPS